MINCTSQRTGSEPINWLANRSPVTTQQLFYKFDYSLWRAKRARIIIYVCVTNVYVFKYACFRREIQRFWMLHSFSSTSLKTSTVIIINILRLTFICIRMTHPLKFDVFVLFSWGGGREDSQTLQHESRDQRPQDHTPS